MIRDIQTPEIRNFIIVKCDIQTRNIIVIGNSSVPLALALINPVITNHFIAFVFFLHVDHKILEGVMKAILAANTAERRFQRFSLRISPLDRIVYESTAGADIVIVDDHGFCCGSRWFRRGEVRLAAHISHATVELELW